MFRVVLQLAASRHWPVHQLDINNAFLYGHLRERVLCQHPSGFIDPTRPDDVFLLSRSLYGLKQAPHAWYQRIAAFLTALGFCSTTSDTSLFVLHRADHVAMLLLYVDDNVITTSRTDLLHDIIGCLGSKFRLKDLGALHFFLGIKVRRDASGFFLHQGQYVLDLLDHVGMTDCKPAATPAEAKPKLSATVGQPATDALSTVALLVIFSTSCSPDQTFSLPCNKFACTCNRLVMFTGLWSSAFSGIFAAHRPTTFVFVHPPPPSFLPTLMRIGLAILTLDNPHRDIVSSSMTLSSHGPLSGNPPSPA